MFYPVIWVEGFPKTKGSWTPVYTTKSIKFRPASKGAANWFKYSKEIIKLNWKWPMIVMKPVSVILEFHLPKPKTVKREYPISKYDGDIDKFCRAIFDAMTGSVYEDDSQVVKVYLEKKYENPCGVLIYIKEIGGQS